MRPIRVPVLAATLTLVAALAVMPTLARADSRQTENFSIWHQMDDCAKQANKQFPDHTPDSNAKREAARQACLRSHRLPVTAPVAPPPPR
jgi:hypothetical protein